MFRVNNSDTRKRCEYVQRLRRSGVDSIVVFEQVNVC